MKNNHEVHLVPVQEILDTMMNKDRWLPLNEREVVKECVSNETDVFASSLRAIISNFGNEGEQFIEEYIDKGSDELQLFVEKPLHILLFNEFLALNNYARLNSDLISVITTAILRDEVPDVSFPTVDQEGKSRRVWIESNEQLVMLIAEKFMFRVKALRNELDDKKQKRAKKSKREQ